MNWLHPPCCESQVMLCGNFQNWYWTHKIERQIKLQRLLKVSKLLYQKTLFSNISKFSIPLFNGFVTLTVRQILQHDINKSKKMNQINHYVRTRCLKIVWFTSVFGYKLIIVWCIFQGINYSRLNYSDKNGLPRK